MSFISATTNSRDTGAWCRLLLANVFMLDYVKVIWKEDFRKLDPMKKSIRQETGDVGEDDHPSWSSHQHHYNKKMLYSTVWDG